GRNAAGLRHAAEVPGGPVLAGPDPLPRVLRRRHGRGAGRLAPDGLDGARRVAHRRVAAAPAGVLASGWAGGAGPASAGHPRVFAQGQPGLTQGYSSPRMTVIVFDRILSSVA